MENKDLLKAISNILNSIPEDSGKWSLFMQEVFYVETLQFVKNYIGEKTEFYSVLQRNKNDKHHDSSKDRFWDAKYVLEAIQNYLGNNLDIQQSSSYRIKNDMVSDFLMQADSLLDGKYHPVSAAILIGATLEEFLRMLIDRFGIVLSTNRKSIDSYAKELYSEGVITKQDLKDITVWAGLRNEASHGKFEEVNDVKRIKLALEGVNLFIRKMNMTI